MEHSNPRLLIDLNKLRENAQTMVNLCKPKGISVMGVTKSYSADTKITQAFQDGGINEFADSRLENIIKQKKDGVSAPFMLIRIPMPSQAAEIVSHAEMSVNSEIYTIKLLNQASAKSDKRHGVMLMIDVGDLREGIWPDKVDEIVPEILKCQHIEFFGLGTNLGCYGGVVPTKKNLSVLVDIANKIDMKYGHPIKVLSAGGTSVVKLIEDNEIPDGVNQVRLGEALMSGVDSVNLGRPINGLWKDAFTLIAEIVEIQTKPSVPVGSYGPNAFNEESVFVDKGLRKRAILAVGKQDMFFDRLVPYKEGIEILGGSSDHFLLDVTDCKDELRVGDELAFNVTWDNVLRLTTSPYIKKEYNV
jgi:predicted amino acid racemase